MKKKHKAAVRFSKSLLADTLRLDKLEEMIQTARRGGHTDLLQVLAEAYAGKPLREMIDAAEK